MKTLDTYIGIEPFDVLVDDSPQLWELAERVRTLRDLPFPEKLEAVKRVVLEAMVNAYEKMRQPRTRVEEYEVLDRKAGTRFTEAVGSDNSQEIERFKEIVDEFRPLSHALGQRAGCCRYQGALFFVLAYEADLGDQHFLQAAVIDPNSTLPVKEAAKTVFNELIHGGIIHPISIFKESVNNPRYDYTRKNPDIFKQAIPELERNNFYSYHRNPAGLVLVSSPNRHIQHLDI